MRPEAAKARLLELVGTIPSLVRAPEECRSSGARLSARP